MTAPAAADSTFLEQRRTLLGVAYRLLGSWADAEDVVQEAWVRWSAARDVEQPAAWLRTVVTRLCLDELRSARVRRESYVGPWLPEPAPAGELGPLETAELRDSVSLALLSLLERLSPAERAVFVLREAFALPYDEVAASVGRSSAACRQLHVRARARLGPELPVATTPAQWSLVDRFLHAIALGDVPAVTALLVEDVVLISDGGGVVSAARRPVVGADRVGRFLVGLASRYTDGLAVDVEEVNGGLAVVVRLEGRVTQVVTFDVRDGQVRSVQILANPAKLQAISPAQPGPVTVGGAVSS